MKKFEIINDKWIKKVNLDGSKLNAILFAIKISEIKSIICFEGIATISSTIRLNINQSTYIELVYVKGEEQDFKEDIIFFENLLFK